jgi:hypothetical protein
MVVNNAMEENRFLRAYQEHKREKEQLQNYRESNNRFDCLRETRVTPIRESAGRFECLRSSEQDVRVISQENNRFNCLVDNSYRSHPVREERITYLPRPDVRESINTKMRHLQEEKRAIAATKPPPPPVFSFESNYHFPELGKEQEIPSNSKMPRLKPEIKIPESNLSKEMIVSPIIIRDKRNTMTLMSFSNGKLVTKEVYEDGTEIPEEGKIILKKPTYTSWASVIKKDENEIYYETEYKKPDWKSV